MAELPTTDRYQNFSIELDCPPGRPRPGDLIVNVLTNTGLLVGDFEEPSKTFGNWIWVLREDAGKDGVYEAARPKLREKIEQLYHSNVIRYGSW
jgi:hypothetical protein